MPRSHIIPIERADDSDVEDNIYIPHAPSVAYTASTNAVRVEPLSPQKRQPETGAGISSLKRKAVEPAVVSPVAFSIEDDTPDFDGNPEPQLRKSKAVVSGFTLRLVNP